MSSEQPSPSPTPPADLDPLVRAMLESLRGNRHAATLVIGGGIALKHHIDYRSTHDLDAWWSAQSTAAEREETLAVCRTIVQTVAHVNNLEYAERQFGDVTSLELHDPTSHQAVSSLQVAQRDRYLSAPVPSTWAPVQLEALADTLASKMTALINRGAPRDMRDIYVVCQAGLTTVEELWQLWQRTHPGVRQADAALQIHRHLAALEARRPLASLPRDAKAAAASTRQWLREQLAVSLDTEEERER